MPDIPASSLAAAEAAIVQAADDHSHDECTRGSYRVTGNSREFARAALEAAAPLLAGDLREHIDTDHGVMVQLGLIADAAVKMLEHVNMDTDEDRELHARATGALRGRLGELAAAMKEANEAANPSAPAAGTGEES